MTSAMTTRALWQFGRSIRTTARAGLRATLTMRDDERRMLSVRWDDGIVSRFPYAWLRDNAPAPHTYEFTKRNKGRVLLMSDFEPTTVPQRVATDSDGSVTIDWSSDGSQPATYTAEWLRARDMDLARLDRYGYHYHPNITWGVDEASTELLDKPVDWNEFLNDDTYLRDALVRFMSYGFMVVKNVPAEPNQLAVLGKRLGYLLNSHYGKRGDASIFSVFAEPDPSNLMNTPRALGLHTDFPQYTQPPEIQVLHCIRQSGSGGESQFCDGFRVGEQMRVECPELFEALCDHAVEYIDWGTEHYKFQFASRWKTFNFDEDGEFKSVFFNNQIRGWYYDCPVEKLETLMMALKRFNDYCYQPRNLLETKLNAGEMVWFMNNRVLHGRSAFKVQQDVPITRHLEGAYLSFDVVKSKIRVVNEQCSDNAHVSL